MPVESDKICKNLKKLPQNGFGQQALLIIVKEPPVADEII